MYVFDMSTSPGVDISTIQRGICKYVNILASDGSSGPGILCCQSLGYPTQAHSCKSTLSEFTFARKVCFQAIISKPDLNLFFISILGVVSNDLSKFQSQRSSKFVLVENKLTVTKMGISLNSLRRPPNLNYS